MKEHIPIQELRIGNYVYSGEELFKTKLRTISETSNSEFYGIPLTQEEFSKFEFIKSEDLKLVFPEKKETLGAIFKYRENFFKYIKYVHELQNLVYLLSKQELEYV